MNTTDTALASLAAAPGSALPTEAGFYWWRETERADWRMVQIVDCGGSQYLNAYDVQFASFGGRGLKYWKPHFPIGEWVKALPPKTSNRPTTDTEVGGSVERPVRQIPTQQEWDEILTAARVDTVCEVLWVVQFWRKMCFALQECIQRHKLGAGGFPIHEVVIDEIERIHRPPNAELRHGAKDQDS